MDCLFGFRGRKKYSIKCSLILCFDIVLYDYYNNNYMQYLGELEEEGVAGLEEDEATPTLPLLCIPNRVLFPEETLPMHIYNPHVSESRDIKHRQPFEVY